MNNPRELVAKNSSLSDTLGDVREKCAIMKARITRMGAEGEIPESSAQIFADAGELLDRLGEQLLGGQIFTTGALSAMLTPLEEVRDGQRKIDSETVTLIANTWAGGVEKLLDKAKAGLEEITQAIYEEHGKPFEFFAPMAPDFRPELQNTTPQSMQTFFAQLVDEMKRIDDIKQKVFDAPETQQQMG
jgi:hypothetical protein